MKNYGLLKAIILTYSLRLSLLAKNRCMRILVEDKQANKFVESSLICKKSNKQKPFYQEMSNQA